ncbi:hypothetical protein SSCG_01103 [Streptomyces clavuligerus]|nr:hypothetical protein SSCG_01103 [Streptomyces clavuligerus]
MAAQSAPGAARVLTLTRPPAGACGSAGPWKESHHDSYVG